MAYRTLVKTNILEASRVTGQEKLHHHCVTLTGSVLCFTMFERFLLFRRVKNKKISGEFKTWPAVLLFCFTKTIWQGISPQTYTRKGEELGNKVRSFAVSLVSSHSRVCRSRIGVWHLQTADRRPQTADRRLQTADCRLQTADRRLQTADCRLQTADHRL